MGEEKSGTLGRIGRYHLTRPLGRGGMGIVYAGFDPVISREVALKTLTPESFSDGEESTFIRNSLLAEARSAGRLQHPSIVAVYDVGLDGEIAYIVMELVNGTDLRAMVRDRIPSPVEALRILKATATAIDFAHQCGVIHRDVKPANILVDATGAIKLTDFGISKSNFRETGGQTVHVLGTPSYMSPEQTRPGHISERTDQYSLAVVAYQLLTGKLPFEGSRTQSVFEQICVGERPDASQANKALPSSVNDVFKKALAIKAGDRYRSCSEFVSELERCFATGIHRRHTGPWLWTALVFVLALGGSAWYRHSVSITSDRHAAPSMPPTRGLQLPITLSGLPEAKSSQTAAASTSRPISSAGELKTSRPRPFSPAGASNGSLTGPQPVTKPAPIITSSLHSANSADADSVAAVGESYLRGDGVAKDRVKAIAWLTRAADAGSRRGMKDLAQLYLHENPAEAARWFTKASNSGDADSRYYLGLLYQQGRGVPHNDQLALELLRSAAASGQPEARARLRRSSNIPFQITGIQPVAILPGPARLYRLLGAGLSLRTLVEVTGAQFVGANVGVNRVQEADPEGKWIKVFIGLNPNQVSGTVQVTVRDGSAQSSLSVPIAN